MGHKASLTLGAFESKLIGNLRGYSYLSREIIYIQADDQIFSGKRIEGSLQVHDLLRHSTSLQCRTMREKWFLRRTVGDELQYQVRK